MKRIDESYSGQQQVVPPGEDHSPKSLFRRLVMHASKLADSEIELVKAQGQVRIEEVKKKTNILILAYLFLLTGLFGICGALVVALSPEIPAWITMLVLGTLSFIAGICALRSQLNT